MRTPWCPWCSWCLGGKNLPLTARPDSLVVQEEGGADDPVGDQEQRPLVPVRLPVQCDQVDDQDRQAEHDQLEGTEEQVHPRREEQADQDEERGDEERDLRAGADRDADTEV